MICRSFLPINAVGCIVLPKLENYLSNGRLIPLWHYIRLHRAKNTGKKIWHSNSWWYIDMSLPFVSSSCSYFGEEDKCYGHKSFFKLSMPTSIWRILTSKKPTVIRTSPFFKLWNILRHMQRVHEHLIGTFIFTLHATPINWIAPSLNSLLACRVKKLIKSHDWPRGK